MAVRTETPGVILEPDLLRKLALSRALDRIVECLAVPSARVRGLYDELGISCHEVERVVHRRRFQLGVLRRLGCSHLKSSMQIGAVYGCSDQEGEEETRSSGGVVSVLVHDLTLYFAEEIPKGGHAHWSSRTQLEALSSGIRELRKEREQTALRAKLTQKQQELVKVLAGLLVKQRERGEGNSSLWAGERDAEFNSAPSLPAAGSQMQAESQASRISLPRDDFRLRSLVSPAQQDGGDSAASPPWLALIGERRHQSYPSEESIYLQSSSSRDGDEGRFYERREQYDMASSEGVGGNGNPLATSGSARSAQEIEVLCGQRDYLARSLSPPEECSDALEPGQRRKEEALQRSVEALRLEIAVEKKRRGEDVARLKDEVVLLHIEANHRKRNAEKAEKGWTAADPRHAEKYAGDAFGSEGLEQKAAALEERSRATAVKNGRLQERLNAALGNLEGSKREGDARIEQAEETARRCGHDEANPREKIGLSLSGTRREHQQRRKRPQDEVAAAGAGAIAVATVRRERAESVETVSTREEIAAIRSRLHSTTEEMETVRLKAYLEGCARSLEELTACKEKAAIAGAEAAALRQSCERHKTTISELTSSREEEGEGCRAARTALAKERLAHAESAERVKDLELKFVRLSSSYQQQQQQQQISIERMKTLTPPPVFVQTCPNHHESMNRVSRAGSEGVESVAAWSKSMAGPREAREREKTRNAVFALEESLNAAREESKQLRERFSWERSRFREEERRAIDMEAAAASARAKVDKMTEAMEAAIAKAEAATARSHEADQKALTAKDREERRAAELEAEVFQMTGELREAREGRAVAQRETHRLRSELEESDRRAADLERDLVAAAVNLRVAETERARANMDFVECIGIEAKRQSVRDDGSSSLPSGGARPPGVGAGTDLANRTGFMEAFEISMLPPPPDTALEDGALSKKYRAVSASDGKFQLNELRERLAASQAQHQELIHLSKKSITEFREHCEARIRTVVAASTLSAACCRWRGISAGQDAAVDAAAQLALVRRCFCALREEALLRSRERSIRRQKRLQLWIVEAMKKSGEEILPRNIRHRSESVDGELARPFASETHLEST